MYDSAKFSHGKKRKHYCKSSDKMPCKNTSMLLESFEIETFLSFHMSKSKMCRLLTIAIFICMLNFINASQNKVPSNFYGSPEVFSGYLSNSDVFIEAFTLNDNHVNICGSTPEVEHTLETIDTAGENNQSSIVLNGNKN